MADWQFLSQQIEKGDPSYQRNLRAERDLSAYKAEEDLAAAQRRHEGLASGLASIAKGVPVSSPSSLLSPQGSGGNPLSPSAPVPEGISPVVGSPLSAGQPAPAGVTLTDVSRGTVKPAKIIDKLDQDTLTAKTQLDAIRSKRMQALQAGLPTDTPEYLSLVAQEKSLEEQHTELDTAAHTAKTGKLEFLANVASSIIGESDRNPALAKQQYAGFRASVVSDMREHLTEEAQKQKLDLTPEQLDKAAEDQATTIGFTPELDLGKLSAVVGHSVKVKDNLALQKQANYVAVQQMKNEMKVQELGARIVAAQEKNQASIHNADVRAASSRENNIRTNDRIVKNQQTKDDHYIDKQDSTEITNLQKLTESARTSLLNEKSNMTALRTPEEAQAHQLEVARKQRSLSSLETQLEQLKTQREQRRHLTGAPKEKITSSYTQESPAKPTTQDEFNKLSSGDHYINPKDGAHLIKK